MNNADFFYSKLIDVPPLIKKRLSFEMLNSIYKYMVKPTLEHNTMTPKRAREVLGVEPESEVGLLEEQGVRIHLEGFYIRFLAWNKFTTAEHFAALAVLMEDKCK